MSAASERGWPATLRSRRVSLRALRAPDETPAWLEEAEAAVRGAPPACPLLERVAEGDAAYWIRIREEGRAQTVGALCAAQEGDALVWTWLAVEAARRAYGYGGAAVAPLERAAKRLGLRSARVLVPARNGTGLYFWLRLGYRPLGGERWPKAYRGTWMLRERL